MTTDITVLVATSCFLVASALLYTTARIVQWDYRWVTGNRDTAPQDRPWVGRAERAHRNLLESFPIFAALVLAAHVTGHANDTTAMGAIVFLGARLAYAVVYMIGIPWLRTAIWGVAVAGMGLIASQLV